MRSFSLIILILSFSSLSGASSFEKSSKSLAASFLSSLKSGLKDYKTPQRGIASIGFKVSLRSFKDDFFKKKWLEYSKMNPEVRTEVLDNLKSLKSFVQFDEMVLSVYSNKSKLTQLQRLRSAELKGQYDAFKIWQK